MPENKPHVLVVDDDAESRKVLRKILEPSGYEVEEAADGQEALAQVARRIPDLVLLDITMPVMDGWAVCRKLKWDARTRLVPVVILTALDARADRLKGKELGADEFLSKPFDISELITRVRVLVSLKRYTDDLELAASVLTGMAQVIQKRDQQTGDHCGRVGELAVKIGTALDLGVEDLKNLRLGGLLHDLGKVAIPDSILGKTGPLTEEEMAVVRTHAAIGAELVAPMRTLKGALPLIRHHHEKLDGSGYPDGLKGAEIPLLVRILSVADIYDVLSSRRPYKEALPKHKCLSILRDEHSKGWWDGAIVDKLERILP